MMSLPYLKTKFIVGGVSRGTSIFLPFFLLIQ